MQIVLGALASIITILWLLHRLAEMGIDLGGLNPWLWRRRRSWKRAYDANPVYAITSPMEATALLLTATAKADGDMSAEEKREILRIFQEEFHLAQREAEELLASSAYLLGRGEEVRDNLESVLAPSLASFSADQAASAASLLHRIATIGGPATESQTALVDRAQSVLLEKTAPKPKWS